jgi:hypothetical protein
LAAYLHEIQIYHLVLNKSSIPLIAMKYWK